MYIKYWNQGMHISLWSSCSIPPRYFYKHRISFAYIYQLKFSPFSSAVTVNNLGYIVLLLCLCPNLTFMWKLIFLFVVGNNSTFFFFFFFFNFVSSSLSSCFPPFLSSFHLSFPSFIRYLILIARYFTKPWDKKYIKKNNKCFKLASPSTTTPQVPHLLSKILGHFN